MVRVYFQQITKNKTKNKNKNAHTRLGLKYLIYNTLTINRWLSMVVARNLAWLNGLANVVEDGNLRIKKDKIRHLKIHRLKIGVNVCMTPSPSLVLYHP